MKLRTMLAEDVESVQRLESRVTDFPWPPSQFQAVLTSNYDCLILEIQGKPAGFAIFSNVLDETTLLNIAIDIEQQGSGCGRYLLEQGLLRQSASGMRQCFLEVRQSNSKAIGLYQSLGFKKISTRKAYYPAATGREDAIVMSRSLPNEICGAI